MIETFGDKLREVEKNYERKHPPTAVVIDAAVLVEGLLSCLFKTFFLSLTTEEERRRFIDFERQIRQKHKDFPNKIMLGQAIGAYLDLCRTFPDHPWLKTALKDHINRLNQLRIKAVHPEKGKIEEKDATAALKAAQKILEETGWDEQTVDPLGFPLNDYLRYRWIKDLFETAEDDNAYAQIIRNAAEIIPTLMQSLSRRMYPELSPDEKEAALALNESHSPTESFHQLALFKRLLGGSKLKQQLADIEDCRNKAPSRVIAADHVHLLDQLFTPFLDPETENQLEFANRVRLLYIDNKRISRADRQRLQAIAQDRNIPDHIAERIQITVAATLREEGIEPVLEPETETGAPDEPHKPRKKRRFFSTLTLAAALLTASAALLYLFPDWPVVRPVNRLIRQTLLSLSPPETWEDPLTGMRFVYVPGGVFQMGCDGSEDACPPFEQPIHEVRLDDFWIAKTEVTQGQWRDVMKTNPSAFQKCGEDCPVEMVSWDDAQAFIDTLNENNSSRFRLPTEAEWEYACRSGGLDAPYAGGGLADVSDLAWFSANSNGKPHPVGTKKANDLGIYDMSGNVWEWCQDGYDDNAYADHLPKNPAVGPRTEQVIRGGAWNYPPSDIRCGFRAGRPPDRRNRNLGFRLVRAPASP